MHCDGGGLYLQCVAGTDAAIRRHWIFRFAVNGRDRQMGLGSSQDVSLAEAREMAADARKLRARGVDPINARNASQATAAAQDAKVVTFEECATAYIAVHRAGWRSTVYAQQWPASFETYVYPVFGNLPVLAVDVALVLKVLEPIWPTKPGIASRIRGRIELVLDWAAAREYRKGENPARWRGHLDKLLPRRAKVRKVKHYAALHYTELGTFLVDLRSREGVAARALEFIIATAARTSEAIGMQWPEVDRVARIWTVPGDRIKSGREHRVPLNDMAMAVLEQMAEIKLWPSNTGYVFPGERRGNLGNMAALMLLNRMGRRGSITVHGFRSTFRDWAAECTNFPNEVAEAALAHIVGNSTEAAYRRGDLFEKRRQLMAAWSDFCGQSAMREPVPIELALSLPSAGPGSLPVAGPFTAVRLAPRCFARGGAAVISWHAFDSAERARVSSTMSQSSLSRRPG
jgi:integrase